jgi:gliding motility-associated-like protein
VKKIFSILCFFSLFSSLGQNMLNNGSFEYGGPGLGFWVDGQGYNLISPPFSGTTSAGDYAFVTNPQTFNPVSFLSFGDHTTGNGKMMVIDGNTTGGSQRFWKAGNNGGGVCNLIVGQQYTFSYWIRTVSNNAVSVASRANIIVVFNNASNVSQVSGTALAPVFSAGWQKVTYNFTPSSTCVNIEMYNTNLNFVDNDFAIDDLSVLPPPQALSETFSFVNPNCSDTISGLIAVYPTGGVAPYSFQLNSSTFPNPITNSTGLFQDLKSGSYNFSVTDANGTVVNQQNIILNSGSGISVNPSLASICPGNSITISASTWNSNYSWTSSNPLDLGFPNMNQSITVSPTTQTTYQIISSVTNTVNLIYNGNFEMGNEGFKTEYSYYTPSNPTGAQRAYGVVSNPSSWYNAFSPCQDHTLGNGTGKMLVLDGSTFNVGNDPFWCQKVAVKPNTNYLFTYWFTSLTNTNLAQAKATFNGTSLGLTTAPLPLCTWDDVSYTWNSGSDTLLEICLIDTNFQSSGNDFAIDDISLVVEDNCLPSSTIFIDNTCNVSTPQIVVPSAFTPNGDGQNDFWELVNIDQAYPENQVKIYNRWGELIYDSPKGNYSSKPWDGTHNNKPMPVGSYFYVITLKEDGSVKPLNGSVSIILKR